MLSKVVRVSSPFATSFLKTQVAFPFGIKIMRGIPTCSYYTGFRRPKGVVVKGVSSSLGDFPLSRLSREHSESSCFFHSSLEVSGGFIIISIVIISACIDKGERRREDGKI